MEQLTFLERIENRGRKPSIRLVHARKPGRISSETSSTTWHETPQHPTRNAIAPDGLNSTAALPCTSSEATPMPFRRPF